MCQLLLITPLFTKAAAKEEGFTEEMAEQLRQPPLINRRDFIVEDPSGPRRAIIIHSERPIGEKVSKPKRV